MSRELTGGSLATPPATVKEIDEWIKSAVAAKRLFNEQKYLKEDQVQLDRIDAGIASLHKEVKDDAWEEDMDYLKNRREVENSSVEESKSKIKDLKLISKNVKPRDWRNVKKDFVVDMSGWRYSKLYRNADRSHQKYAMESYGTITVLLKARSGSSRGSWSPGSSTLMIEAGSFDVLGTIEHEMRHWAQSFLSILTGKKVGLPSKKLINPEISQHGLSYLDSQDFKTKNNVDDLKGWKRRKMRQLKRLNVTRSDFHSLDDVEFYPIIGDVVRRMENILSEKPELGRGERNDLLRDFLKADGELNEIKKFSKPKWMKMVKEILKQVM